MYVCMYAGRHASWIICEYVDECALFSCQCDTKINPTRQQTAMSVMTEMGVYGEAMDLCGADVYHWYMSALWCAVGLCDWVTTCWMQANCSDKLWQSVGYLRWWFTSMADLFGSLSLPSMVRSYRAHKPVVISDWLAHWSLNVPSLFQITITQSHIWELSSLYLS